MSICQKKLQDFLSPYGRPMYLAQAASHRSLTLSSLPGNFLLLTSPLGKASKEGLKFRQLSATVQLQEDKQDHWEMKMSFPGLLSICSISLQPD